MFVNTNVAALNAWLNLDNTQSNMTGLMQQLSSGLRINSAANDPAGLAISQQMQSQISGMNQAYRNAQSGITLLQTADGGMGQVQNILQSMYSLASQAATGTNNSTDLAALQQQMNQYAQEITTVTNDTQFNNLNLLGGAFQNQQIQIGANAGQSLPISVNASDAYSLGVTGTSASVTTLGTALVDTTQATNATGLSATSAGTNYYLNTTVDPFTMSASTTLLGDFATVAGSYTGSTPATISFTINTANTGTIEYSVNGGATQTVTSVNGGAVTIAIGSNTLVFTAASTLTTVNAGTMTVNPMQTVFALSTSSAAGAGAVVTSATIAGGLAQDQLVGLTNTQNSEAYSFYSQGGATTASVTYTITSGAASLTGVGSGFTANTVAGTYTATTATQVDLTNTSYAGSGTPSVFNNGYAASGLDIQSQANANVALTILQNAINQVSSNRAGVGALQNRLQFASTDLQTSSQNLTTARANIVNADVALQMVNLTKDQILQQTGVAMLAQANAMPQALLKLFP